MMGCPLDLFQKSLKKRILRFLSLLFNTLPMLLLRRSNILLINASMNLTRNEVIHSNYGDDLNFFILKHITNKYIFVYHQILNVRRLPVYMCIGSIVNAQWMTQKNCIIWGSGARNNYDPINGNPKKICAVRGKLTRDYFLKHKIDCPEIYGDPALLLPYIYKPQRKKIYKLGIVLHFRDRGNGIVNRIIQENGEEVKLIDIVNYNDWKSIIDNIAECECVASSSLHGLIISDAYKVPNVWIRFGDETFEGAFKYIDYFSGVQRKTTSPLQMTISTTMEEILEQSCHYVPIEFNATLFIHSCPFKIVYPIS